MTPFSNPGIFDIHQVLWSLTITVSYTSCRLLPVTYFLSVVPQPVEVDFSNVRTMIDCGLFSDALDTIRDSLCPGLLPSAKDLLSLLERALQVAPCNDT